MAHIQIQCQNCGAKYKIPEAFKGDTAKCKQCGSTIDVAAQRQAPAEETPASRRPSRRRTRQAETAGASGPSARRTSGRRHGKEKEPESAEPAVRRGGRAAAGGGSRGRGRGRRGRDDDAGEEQGGRARRERKKDPTPLIVGGIIGVLAIVAVTLVYTSWGKVTGKVKLPGFEKEHAAAQKRKEEQAEKERQEQLKAMETEKQRLAKEAAEKAAAKKAKEAAAKKKVPVKVEKLEDIFNPGQLDKVPWSKAVKDDRRKELEELVATAMANAGIHSIRAQRTLEEAGWAALVPITNKLLTLDFKTIQGNNDAFVLAQIVERITGWDPQVATMREGEKIEPQVAHDNAVGVYQLHIKMIKYWTSEGGLKDWQKKNIK